MVLNTTQRRNKILRLLAKKEFMATAELSSALGVSEVSIRKDFDFLEGRGLAKRVHGGIQQLDNTFSFLDISQRYTLRRPALEAIAKTAVKFLNKRDLHIYIDTGISNLLLARAIPAELPITIVTNSLSTIDALQGRDNCRVLSLGGEVDYQRKTFTGIWGNSQLDRLHFDFTFTGADTVCEDGFGDYDPIENETVRKAILRSEKSYVVCDSSKINKPMYGIFALPKEVTGWITDTDADKNFVKKIRSLGGNVILAES